jgi:hypothetical protein
MPPARPGLEDVDGKALLREQRGGAEVRRPAADHGDATALRLGPAERRHHAELARPGDDRRLTAGC